MIEGLELLNEEDESVMDDYPVKPYLETETFICLKSGISNGALPCFENLFHHGTMKLRVELINACQHHVVQRMLGWSENMLGTIKRPARRSNPVFVVLAMRGQSAVKDTALLVNHRS